MRDRERQRRNRRLKHMYQKLEKKIRRESGLFLYLDFGYNVKKNGLSLKFCCVFSFIKLTL